MVQYIKDIYNNHLFVGDGELYYHDGSIQGVVPIDQYHITINTKDLIKIKDDYASTYSTIDDLIRYNETKKRYYLDYDNSEDAWDTTKAYTEAHYYQAVQKAVDDNYVEILPSSLDAEDNSYRYAGNNPNNYVCLGDLALDGSCKDVRNLYRIIGIFPFNSEGIQQMDYQNGMEYRAKLIKSEYITEQELKGSTTPSMYGDNVDELKVSTSNLTYSRVTITTGINSFYWNYVENPDTSAIVNYWEYNGQKATLNTFLNNYYLNTTMVKWQDKIAKTKWHIGGYNTTSKIMAKQIFNAEIGNNSGEGKYPTPEDGYLTTDTKIGLMYLSDYGYTVANNNNEWMSFLSDYNDYKENNWLYNGVYEWTVSRSSNSLITAYYISNGVISTGNVYKTTPYGVRPVFYLNSDIKLSSSESADGSFAHPYTIN